MAVVLKKRLQVQAARRRGIDKWICYVAGDLSEAEQKRIRGVSFPATSKVDAMRTHADLLKMAKQAVAEGTVGDFLDALDRRAARADRGPTFEVFAAEWERDCVEGGGLRESQIESDKSILKNHLLPAFRGLPLGGVDARRIDRYKAGKLVETHQYGKGYSPKTINNHLAVLHRLFEKAIEYGHVAMNPVTKRSWMKADRTAEESRAWWTPEEEGRVVTALEAWRGPEELLRLAIMVQLVTGIRFGELRALRKEDLDFQAPGLWIRRSQARKKVSTPKNKKARFQVVPSALADELKVWMLKTEGQLLFPGASGGALPNNTLNRAYARLAREAMVRVITSHGARHTSGSSYAVLGAGQKMIATLLGHSDTQATERYTHVRVEATKGLVERRWGILSGAILESR